MEERDLPANNILYLNFEDERFLPFTAQHFDLLHATFMKMENPQRPLFLDEILNISGQLDICSQPGSGTTIEVRTPLSKSENLPEGSP